MIMNALMANMKNPKYSKWVSFPVGTMYEGCYIGRESDEEFLKDCKDINISIPKEFGGDSKKDYEFIDFFFDGYDLKNILNLTGKETIDYLNHLAIFLEKMEDNVDNLKRLLNKTGNIKNAINLSQDEIEKYLSE